MKAAMLLLLLLSLSLSLVAVCVNAAPEDCPSRVTENLHQVLGRWVLVYAIHEGETNFLPNVTSSHLELTLRRDNQTVLWNEWNTHQEGDSETCSHYVLNMSRAENHTLQFVQGTLEKDGVIVPYNNSDVDVYVRDEDVSRPGCLVVVYRERHQQFLLIYKREGLHGDVEELKAKRSHFEDMAACRGFKVNKPFVYDGVSGFCHKKSNPDDVVSPDASS